MAMHPPSHSVQICPPLHSSPETNAKNLLLCFVYLWFYCTDFCVLFISYQVHYSFFVFLSSVYNSCLSFSEQAKAYYTDTDTLKTISILMYFVFVIFIFLHLPARKDRLYQNSPNFVRT